MKCIEKCGKCCIDLFIRFSKLEFKEYQRRFPGIEKRISHQDEASVVFADGCPFLWDSKCMIYDERPEFCKMYPVSVQDEGFVITTACPQFSTLTRADIASAKREFAKYKGKTTREKNKFQSSEIWEKSHRKFLQFVEERDNSIYDYSLVIPIDEYLGKLKDPAAFKKWLEELKTKQDDLNNQRKVAEEEPDEDEESMTDLLDLALDQDMDDNTGDD